MANKYIGEDNMGTDIFVGNILFNEKTHQCIMVVELEGCCFFNLAGTLICPKEYLSLHKKYIRVKKSDEKCIDNSCIACCDRPCGDPVDPPMPSLSLVKTGVFQDENEDGVAQVGETILYTFEVCNTGNVPITNITITDSLVTVLGGPIDLEPGICDNTTFSASYTLTEADIEDGSVQNTATAGGDGPDGPITVDDDEDTDLPDEPICVPEICVRYVISPKRDVPSDQWCSNTILWASVAPDCFFEFGGVQVPDNGSQQQFIVDYNAAATAAGSPHSFALEGTGTICYTGTGEFGEDSEICRVDERGEVKGCTTFELVSTGGGGQIDTSQESPIIYPDGTTDVIPSGGACDWFLDNGYEQTGTTDNGNAIIEKCLDNPNELIMFTNAEDGSDVNNGFPTDADALPFYYTAISDIRGFIDSFELCGEEPPTWS